MKKLLLLFGILLLFSCEKEEACYLCTMTKYKLYTSGGSLVKTDEAVYCGYKPEDFRTEDYKYEFNCDKIL